MEKVDNIKLKKRKKFKAKLKKNLLAYAILIPSLVLFAFFVWVPLFQNVLVSFFTDFDYAEFVGFQNYQDIFGDTLFITALKNTFVYIFWSLIIGFFLPMILGFLLSECFHAKGIFRTIIYIPCMISGIAVVFLFQNIYGDETYSILNVIIEAFGGQPHLWASDPNLVIPLIVIAMTWKGMGGTSLIYLSNFQNIDRNLYEASRIDGAGPLKRFFKITMPQMKSTILTLLILQIISVFQVFYEPLVIGNKGDSSISLMLLSYMYAFEDFEYAEAAATSVILALIIITFTIIYFVAIKRFEKKEKGGVKREKVHRSKTKKAKN